MTTENESLKIYDLEDKIMQCWTIKEDIALIRKNADDLLKEGFLEESLLGIEIMADLRFKDAMSVLSDIVSTCHLVSRKSGIDERVLTELNEKIEETYGLSSEKLYEDWSKDDTFGS